MMFATKKFFLLSLLVFSASVTAYVLMFAMLEAKIEQAQQLTASILEAQKDEAEGRLLAQQLDETVEERATLDSYFIASDGIVRFLEAVESVGVASGAQVEVSGVTEAEAGGRSASAGDVEIRVLLAGSWSEVVHALALIELLPFHLRIARVGLSAGSPERDASTGWEGSVVIHLAPQTP